MTDIKTKNKSLTRNDAKRGNSFSRFPFSFSPRFAFTLAEVLITLAIIGVVAALTIPVLVSKIQQNELETAFKKVFTNLEQAYALYYSDRGNVAPDFRKDEDKLAFLNYFKTVSSTIPLKYKVHAYDKSFANATYGPDGVEFRNPYFRVLQDGSFMGFAGAYVGGLVMVDTNGPKPPNSLGYDIFIFASATQLVYTDTVHWWYVPQGWDGLYGPKNSVLGAAVSGLDNQHLNVVPNDQFCAPISKGGFSDYYMSGNTCTYFAVQNICPWDSSKTYWQTLP